MKRLLSFLLLLIPCQSILAEVTSAGETGFNIRIATEVAVTPDEAYQQFVDVADWWVESHSYFGKRENFSIDARAGGCFCEIEGDRQVQHMQVTYVDPGRELKMIGGLGPLQMMGIHGGMSWRFEATDSGTRIVQSYNVTGYAPGGLKDLAEIVNAVQMSQQQALTAHINLSD